MGIFRTYFFDEKGNELLDHPLNGKHWLASSGWMLVNGEMRKLYREQVTVADFSSMRKIIGEKNVTLADFPGHRKVGVKVWQGPDSSDKFWLSTPAYFENRPGA